MTNVTLTPEINQGHLVAALDQVRVALERHVARHGAREPEGQGGGGAALRRVSAAIEFPLCSLDLLCSAFGLSSFEQAVLVLCAGLDLDSSFAGLCAAAHGDPGSTYATFSLALAALPDAHWSALNPAAPLRHWRMIEVLAQRGSQLTTSPLKIDERILHFLAGVQHLDERLAGLVEPLEPDAMGEAESLVPSHQRHAEQIAALWDSAALSPLIELCGADGAGKRAIAAQACARRGLRLYAFAAEHTPAAPLELDGFIRLWERETVLASTALYIDADALDPADSKLGAQFRKLLEALRGPVLLSTRERWPNLLRPVRVIEVGKPSTAEQQVVWQGSVGDKGAHLGGELAALAAQFNLPAAAIRASVEQALEAGPPDDHLLHALWDASCSQARPRMAALARRIVPLARWDDLVLPAHEKKMLREIALHVRHRATVYDAWGFARASNRGLGVSALFSGGSGTGKTMAAEVLANELRLDLHRVDLSGVVSKYIGETEKNLRQVFDAAEEGGTILFFDEADALFGKRSEVKDSHDRYANIEINYLLQRMESYRGLAVLATNMRSALDTAFLRRLRFVVNFPFPDPAQRAEIWRRAFPAGAPVGRLDYDKLARLDMAGGNIRNVALHAAFLAAAEASTLEMSHLAQAARTEFTKIDKPVPEPELARWGQP
jgi:hypothetical protein